jgi:hypothetical protein
MYQGDVHIGSAGLYGYKPDLKQGVSEKEDSSI